MTMILYSIYMVLVCMLMRCSEYSDSPPAPSYLEAVKPPRYTVKYYQQYLDHFNYAVNHSWKEKYLIADEYWNGKGPMFFYTGNEGPIESFYNNSGFVFTLAKKFSALVVFAEHRYYGDSMPFGKESFDPVAMGFLSIEQALADFAVLISSLRQQYSGISKTIAVGGSYGGILSVWMRFKYPNLVDGAFAASAPLLYIDKDSPFSQQYETVTKDFASIDKRCPQYVREGFSKILELSETGTAGLSQITKDFKLCQPLTSDEVDGLIGWVKTAFFYLAMCDYPYPAFLMAPLPAYPVKTACHRLLSENNRLRGLAQAAGVYYNGSDTDTKQCFNIAEDDPDMVCSEPTGCGIPSTLLSWDYQSCTQLYIPTKTNNVTDMFPPEAGDNTDHCMKQWKVNPRPGWMRTEFWGKDILSATNIIFSNGDRDPWSTGGVTKSLSDSLIAIMIKGGAHHLDLRAPNPKDPPSVVVARKREMEIIAGWIYQ